MHYYLVKSQPKSFLQPEAVLTWVEHLTHKRIAFVPRNSHWLSGLCSEPIRNQLLGLAGYFQLHSKKSLVLEGVSWRKKVAYSKSKRPNAFWMSRRVWHFSFNYSYTVTLACVFFCKQQTEIELYLPVLNYPFSKQAGSLRRVNITFLSKSKVLQRLVFSQTRRNACYPIEIPKDFFFPKEFLNKFLS